MQRLFPDNLTACLAKQLAPCYFLTGQDVLLVNESKDHIVQAARLAHFDEKTEITVANDTDWQALFEQANSNGLFFSRQILILNLPDTLTAALQKQLSTLLSLQHSDLLLIFHLPKLTKQLENQDWFNANPQAVQINCQTPDINKLPSWLQTRAKQMQLTIENDAIGLLCYSYESNLFALKQALQLLQLYFPDGKITLSRAKEIVEQSAQFTPFQWVDALLEGKPTRARRILNHLKNEDVQAVILLRLIQKELCVLLELADPAIDSTQLLIATDLRHKFDRLKVWQNRRVVYQNALKRLTYRQLYQLIQQLADLERAVKQTFNEDIWQQLERFSSGFTAQRDYRG